MSSLVKSQEQHKLGISLTVMSPVLVQSLVAIRKVLSCLAYFYHLTELITTLQEKIKSLSASLLFFFSSNHNIHACNYLVQNLLCSG